MIRLELRYQLKAKSIETKLKTQAYHKQVYMYGILDTNRNWYYLKWKTNTKCYVYVCFQFNLHKNTIWVYKEVSRLIPIERIQWYQLKQ